MTLLRKAALALLVLFTVPAQAQDGLDALTYMKGKWTVSGAFYENGAWGAPTAPMRATGDTVLGGAFIRLDAPISFPGADFQFEMTVSYDRFHGSYRLAFLDDLNGYMDIYEGGQRGGVLTVSNADTGTHFPDGEGGIVIGKMDIEKTPQGFVLNAFTASEKDGPYSPYMRLEFTAIE